MTSAKILDNYHAELQHIAEESPDDVLRWTGEQLATAGERLRTAKADERTARAAELLVIAHPHIEALAAAGEAKEALATQVVALLTVFHARVNPEDFAGLYLQTLQALCSLAGGYVYSAQGPQAMQASQTAGYIFGLFIATAHSYIPRFGASEQMRRFYDHMRHMAANAGEDISHFQGHRIVPTMAIDILTYAAVMLEIKP